MQQPGKLPRFLLIILASCLCWGLSGCGVKGDLYLPKDAPNQAQNAQ